MHLRPAGRFGRHADDGFEPLRAIEGHEGEVHPGDRVVVEGQLRVNSGQQVAVAGGKPPYRP